MFQLFPRLLRLGLAADPLARTRHQKRQGLLLQHVWPSVHLRDVPHEAHVQTHHGGTHGLPPLASARHRRFHHSPADLPHLRPPHSPHGRSPQDSYLSNRFKPTDGTQIRARSVRRSDNELFLLFLVADQTVLSGTPKDDFSALSGLETTGLCTLFCTRLHRKKKLRQLAWKSVIFFFYINDLRLPKSELKYFYIFAS